MNKLAQDKRIRILSGLIEGCSLRTITRMVGVSINTVTKLLVEAGHACAALEFRSS
jgi:transposase